MTAGQARGEPVSRWDLEGPDGNELVMTVETFDFAARVRVYLITLDGWHGPILEAEV